MLKNRVGVILRVIGLWKMWQYGTEDHIRSCLKIAPPKVLLIY